MRDSSAKITTVYLMHQRYNCSVIRISTSCMCLVTCHTCFSRLSKTPSELSLRPMVQTKKPSQSPKSSLLKAKKILQSKSVTRVAAFQDPQFPLSGPICTLQLIQHRSWILDLTKVISRLPWPG